MDIIHIIQNEREKCFYTGPASLHWISTFLNPKCFGAKSIQDIHFPCYKKVLSYKIYIFIIYSRACIEVLCLRLNKMVDLGSCPCALFKVWKAFRSLQSYSMKQDFPAQKLIITVTLEATYMTMRLAVLECSFSSSFSLIWRLVWKAKQTGWNMQVSTYSITIRGR